MNNLDYVALTHRLVFILSTPPASTLLDKLPHPWPEHEAKPPLKPACVGAVESCERNPLRALSGQSLSDPDDCNRIPSETHDPMLHLRGRWRRPPALQRVDFQRVTGMSLEQLLGMIQAKTWPSPTAMAKTFRKQPGWVKTSLKFCCVREGLMTREGFDALWPAMPRPRPSGVKK